MGRLTKRCKQGNFINFNGIPNVTYEQICEKLAHYEDLEEQGKLVEQKYGEWTNERITRGGFHEEWGYDCSECGKTCSYRSKYCPNCGAKMKVRNG